MHISDDITSIPNIGKTKANRLAKLGICTVSDLLHYYPRAYEDRSRVSCLVEAKPGETSNIRGRIAKTPVNVSLPGGRSMQKAQVVDENGDTLQIIWFNQHYLPKTLKVGEEYIFYGKLECRAEGATSSKPNSKGAPFLMTSPLHSRNISSSIGIMPIYPLTSKVTHKMLQDAIRECAPAISEVRELLPQEVLKSHNLCDIHFALKNIHFPLDFASYEKARRRLVFEELFMLTLGLNHFKSTGKSRLAQPIFCKNMTPLIEKFPFNLTSAQNRAIQEILADMSQNVPMSRLLQGDVGSGKTAVAAVAMFAALSCGFSSILMAPTEILAEQHAASLRELFGSKVVLIKRGKKPKINDICIAVGTQAVLQNSAQIPNVGLVITDEQHRFGVRQREALVNKGASSTSTTGTNEHTHSKNTEHSSPHLLVMSATPIPRTLALILYADLDISILNELPPGRKPIETHAVDESYRTRVNAFIRKQITAGRQVYIVCPLVDESDVINAKAATAFVNELATLFPKVGLIHGKMKSAEKAETMAKFAGGELNVLVATSVIEVGVNVPNASLIVVENAERFGLAGLHQLRGRVGRGEHQSYCVLFNQGGKDAAERMRIMSETNDGFKIAERDLELRGVGNFFGTRQHGLPELKIANLYEDLEILNEARTAATTANIPAELQAVVEKMFIEGL